MERTPLEAGRGSAIGRALLERGPIHILDAQTDPTTSCPEPAKADIALACVASRLKHASGQTIAPKKGRISAIRKALGHDHGMLKTTFVAGLRQNGITAPFVVDAQCLRTKSLAFVR
jgi:hypothetical protein